jgi:hypothetical protein
MRRSLQGTLALAVFISACAIPTDAPNWDVVWNLPLPDGGQTIAVNSFLPSGVTIIGTAPSQAFRANVSSAPAIVRTLGVQCPTCPNATAPKPAFTATPATTTVTLAAGASLNSGTLTTGSQMVLQLVNGFTFDPIRPPGGANGTVTLTVANGSTTLGTLTLLGATSAIPAGQSTSFTVPLNGTINTSSPITVQMTMDSPAGAAGSPVTMNPSQLFTVNATPTLNFSQATVTIASQPLTPTTSSQNLADGPMGELETRVDTTGTDTQGSMFLQISNPLAIGAAGTLTINAIKTDSSGNQQTMPTISKPFALPAGPSGAAGAVVQLDFTGKELAHMLGSDVTFTLGGSTGNGTTLVTPTSAITILTRLQLRAFVRETK